MGYFPGAVPSPVSESTEKYIKSQKEKIEHLKKWNPILDALNVNDDKIRLFIAEYAEFQHNKMTDEDFSFDQPITDIEQPKTVIEHPDIDPYGEEDWNDENKKQRFLNYYECICGHISKDMNYDFDSCVEIIKEHL